ncbi:MAG: GNAT family N-acetyltransferase [Pseudomonadota bacterium]
MPEVKIRRADARDGRILGDIFVAARRAALPFLEEAHSPAEIKAWISTVVVPRQTTLVAEMGVRIAGFMTLDDGSIEHLYLDPAMRRAGVGSALIAFAKGQSPEGLTLFCFAENHAACRFYEAHGFRAVKYGDGSDNEEGAPDVLYEWSGRG